MEEEKSFLWSAILLSIPNVTILCSLFLGLSRVNPFFVLFSILFLDILLAILIIIGEKRKKSVEGKDKEVRTFSRKLFNIISGVVVVFLVAICGHWLGIFVVFGLAGAFLAHELIYVKIGKKTYFTDTFNALGRQVNPGEMYMPSFMALFSSAVVLLIAVLFLDVFNSPGLISMLYLVIILTWGIGDTCAYYGGKKYGKHKLIQNREKSLEGSLCFFGAGLIIALIGLSPLTMVLILAPSLPFPLYVVYSIFLAGIAAFFESLARHSKPYYDDNLITPICTSLLAIPLLFLLLIF
ncbi:MAG: hypothetical protein ACTSRW_06060 [Candidatus Helarchaeota archaeon]